MSSIILVGAVGVAPGFGRGHALLHLNAWIAVGCSQLLFIFFKKIK